MFTTSAFQYRNFLSLLVRTAILAATFFIQLTLGCQAGLMLEPIPAPATLLSSLQTLAGMVAGAPVSLLMGRLGRRAGFTFGGLLTFAAAVLGIQAFVSDDFALRCAARFLDGRGLMSFQ